MGDDLIDLAMSYIEDEPMNTIWQPISTSQYIAVEEPEGYRPAEVVAPTQNILNARLANTIASSVYSLGNNLASISYQPPTEEERQAYERFVKAEQKREEKERNYKQFKEFTRMLERTYYN